MSEFVSYSGQVAQPEESSPERVKAARLKTYASMGRLLVGAVVEGAAAVCVDNRIKAAAFPKPLDVRLADHFAARHLSRQTDTGLEAASYSRAELKNIGDIYANVWRWHGTGRYEHRDGCGVTDILQRIADDKGLIPQPDTIDPIAGPMESISTAYSRMYARPYADMHNDRNQPRSFRYGKASTWGRYFMAPVPVEGFIEAKMWRRDVRARYLDDGLKDLRRWRAKVNRTPATQTLYKALDEGSDIGGNYPMMFGIQKGAFEEAHIARTLRRHESRSTTGVPLHLFTHIEVPDARIAETQQLLENNGVAGLPILPIELGEYYCSTFDFSDLVSGKPLLADRA